MAESTALAGHHTDTERHYERTAASGGSATVTTAASTGVATAGAEPLVAEELLVEEVSIDGMCGVY